MSKQLLKPCYEAVINGASSGTLAVGKAVRLGTGTLEVLAVSSASQLVHGFVALTTIASKRDGQIYREGGDAIGLAGGAITKGAKLKIDASGDLIVASANDDAVGYALEAVADGALVAINFTRFQA